MAKESKAAKDLRASIAMHEEALEVLKQKADAATAALDEFQRQEIAAKIKEREEDRRAANAAGGQQRLKMAPIIILEPSDKRKRLEEDKVAALSEVYRIDKKLSLLRQLLEMELAKE